MTIWEVTRALGCTMETAIAAIKATGLKGRLVNGCRVWTPAEVERLRAQVAK